MEDARSSLRQCIVEAYEQGEGASAIADAAGLSRQRVYQILEEEGVREKRMRARLAELDARYDQLVDALAAGEGKPGDYKRVTAIQNGMNRKLSRRGVGWDPVSVTLRNHAESKLLSVLEHRRHEPVVQRILAEIDEAALLRQKLTALDEARAFGETID